MAHASEYPEREYITDIGYGGMGISSDIPFSMGETVNVSVPDLEEKISIVGQVRWRRDEDDHFDIGIEFIHREDDLSCELVSQVYYIEQYLNNEAKKGRNLDFEQASEEWFSALY